MVSLKASSNILGRIISNIGLDSSRQGLVFTSMSHTFKSASIMKSKPKISKQCFLFILLIFFLTERKANFMPCLILGTRSLYTLKSTSCSLKYSYNFKGIRKCKDMIVVHLVEEMRFDCHVHADHS